MLSNKLIQELEDRGFIAQMTNKKALSSIIAQRSITLYCGFDPTADSLHLGHLIPLLCLKRFQQAGHKLIILIGGATSMIGDPSFKNTERKLNNAETVQKWGEKIYKQIDLFLDFDCSKNTAIIVNNYDWFNNMKILTFLRTIAKHFSVNQMLSKEAVKQRLNNNSQGISFTEFTYNLLQSYDFAYLNKLYGVILQIGGSDQWGNIVSGINLTRRLYKNQVFGITFPLMTKSNGTKFGKTEKETIWLDPQKTSPYKFYQFWVNTADTDVYDFLKLFTLMDIADINMLQNANQSSNKTRYAQYLLAEHVTKLVHGENNLAAAKRITDSLFNGTVSTLKKTDFEQLAQDGIPMIKIKEGADLMQALVDSKLLPSRNQAYQNIISNAIAINGKKQSNPRYTFIEKDRLFEHYTLLRRGKKNYCLIYWQHS